jgi:hypothetical protein
MTANRKLNPIGYAWLARSYGLDPIPHFVESFAAEPGIRLTERDGHRRREIYPHTACRLNTVFEHLDFALKREGLHLELLRGLLPRLRHDDVASFVRATPTGGNARRIAYLYECFSGRTLPLHDMATGNYVPLADPRIYFTGSVRKLPRWRIDLNLLHTTDYSPVLRRTPALAPERDAALHRRCADLVGRMPPEIFQRALRYLYAKETRTSYAIERETPTQRRAERFMALLARAGAEDFLTEESLISLQNTVVDPRFAATGWRASQNYVGRTLAPGMEEIHLVPPRPEDLAPLMRAWIETARYLATSDTVPPVAASALAAWSFVFLHPFEDGNGRVHRFLIHHLLAARHFGPPGVLLPVSAVLLNRPADYDASLEAFSIPLKERSEYELSGDGRMTVLNATLDHFRYIDCTAMAEALHGFLEETIEKEIPAELRFLRSYDAALAAMRDVVDLPEPAANLFLRLCLQNAGHLSQTKRKLPAFARLTEDEIDRLEQAVSSAYPAALQDPSDAAAEITPPGR